MVVSALLLGLAMVLAVMSGCSCAAANCTEVANSSCESGAVPQRSIKVLAFNPGSFVHCQLVTGARGNVTETLFSEGCEIHLSIQRALNEIEERFSNFSLEVNAIETQTDCSQRSSYETISHFVREVFNNEEGQTKVTAVIGPSCSNSAAGIADIIKRGSLPIVQLHTAILPIDRQFKSRQQNLIPPEEKGTERSCSGSYDVDNCSSSFGMLGSTDTLVDASLSLMRHNNWTSIAVLYSIDSTFKLSSIFNQFARAIEELESSDSSTNERDDITSLISEFYDHSLSDIRDSDLRIIYILANEKAAREILCFALHRKMRYPAYQWIVVSALATETMREVNFTINGISYYCSPQDMSQSLEKAFVISHQRTSVMGNSLSSGVGYSDNLSMSASVGGLYYDAFWSLAQSVDNSLSCFRNLSRHGNASLARCIKEQLYALRIESESIKFNRSTGFVQRPVRIDQFQNEELIQVALHDSTQDSNLILSNLTEFSAIFYTFERVPLLVPLGLGVAGLVTSVLTFVVILACHILSIVFRKSPTVRASSPNLQNVAYIGYYFLFFALMIYVTVKTFPSSDKTYIDLCVIHNYVIFIGLTLLLGTICAKTWRLYRIFMHYLDPGKYLSDKHLTIFVLSLTLVDFLMCTLWTTIDPSERIDITPVNNEKLEAKENGTIRIYSVCDSDFYFSWFTILSAYQLVILLAALYLALKTRKRIPKSQKRFQMTSVLTLIYLTFFLMVFGTIFYSVAQQVAMEIIFEFIAWSVLFNLVFISCLVFLFLPPLIPTLRRFRQNLGTVQYHTSPLHTSQ